MWTRISFRLKITIIFTTALMVLTVSLTALSLMNARQNITNPMELSLGDVTLFLLPDFAINSENENAANIFTAEQFQELLPDFALDSDTGIDPDSFTAEQWQELLSFLTDENTIDLSTVEQLQEQLSIAQQDFRQHSFWVAGIVILLSSLGVYWVAGIIVRPIKVLSTSMKEMEADQLQNNRPVSKNQDEISQLNESFGGMLDKLHRTFESKQLFAQNAAHELKTPLAIIRADMEVMEMNDEPTVDDYEEIFVEVKKNTERMIDLVEGLLAMGKSPNHANMTVFHGRDLFERILEDLNEPIHAKGLNVQVDGDTTIKGEKSLLPQAFFNLIANAVRYNVEGGGIVITLSENQIIIDDTGIGIPPESMEQLFDPFYCVDKSRSKKLGGNGLGLAITKNILDAHQMRIDITSVVSTGTTVAIHI